MGRKNSLALAFIGLFGACAAYGDVAYEVSSGIGSSDNITRVDENEIDETLASAGLLLDWEADSRRLSGAAQVDLSYVEYLDDTFDGEILGTASGNVDFGIVPERLHWKVDDNFGQARSDPFEPVTPDNRENINYFSTGPELSLRFGQAMSATLYGTYSHTDYEDSPLDAERVSLGVALGRDISERSNWALNFSSDDSTFDAATMPGYERRAAFASYELGTGGRTAVSTRLGYNWVELDGANESGGLLADLSLTRELSPSSALVVSAAKNFSDAGESLGGPRGGTTSITASADPFESTQASLEWRFSRRRTTLSLSTNYNEREYQTQSQFDSKAITYRADVGRQLRSTLRFALRMTYSTEEFQAGGFESDDWSANALLDWQFGRRAGLELSVERSARSSSIGTGEFRENRAYLGFTFHGDRAPELR